MKKIAITGANGLVGSRIVELLQNDFEFIPLHHKDVDITNKDQVHNTLKDISFDLLLHLAAYTDVDKAEQEKETAYKLNVDATKNLLETTIDKHKKFIYISTDFVFDGTKPPYYENSPPQPLGYYGQTKLQGEQLTNKNGMIVRLCFPYRAQFEPKKDFVRTLKWLLEQRRELKMITNCLITPTFIDDTAYALKYLINNFTAEIFHIVGGDSLSSYEAALQIAKTFNLDISFIHKTTYAEYYQHKAKRPQFSEMKTKKNNFYRMKTFAEGLEEIKKQLTI